MGAETWAHALGERPFYSASYPFGYPRPLRPRRPLRLYAFLGGGGTGVLRL